MGDRATIQVVGSYESSPVIYLHWAGPRAMDIIRKAAPIMRRGDCMYAAARLLGVCHTETDPEQGLSLGISNADGIQKEDTCGDNGHFLVDLMADTVTHYQRGCLTVVHDDIEFGRF